MPLSFVFLAYRICPLVLKLQNASDTHCNRVNTKTTTGAGPPIEFIVGISNLSELSLLKRAL